MTSPTRIVTSVTVLMWFDGSAEAVGTLPVARKIARVMEGSLHLVLSSESGEARERLSLLTPQEAEARLHELIGNPALGIVRLATFNPGAYIVAPAYGPSRPETGLGLVAEEILRRAECPVLIVQPSTAYSSWKLDRILVPQDGTADAARALCPATRLAERSGAEVLVLHVSPERSAAAPRPGVMECPFYVDQPQHEWPSWVSAFVERVRHLCRMSPHALLRFHWASGDPGREILALARRKRVDLITMSWTRREEPGRPQVVRQVLREAPCPILILPGALS